MLCRRAFVSFACVVIALVLGTGARHPAELHPHLTTIEQNGAPSYAPAHPRAASESKLASPAAPILGLSEVYAHPPAASPERVTVGPQRLLLLSLRHATTVPPPRS